MLRTLRATPAATSAPPVPTRRARLRAERRLRSRRRTTAALAAVAIVAGALPSAAAAGGTVDEAPGGGATSAVAAEIGGVVAPEGAGTLPLPDRGPVRALATIEDAEAWCSYLSSYYLAFPSPWSARVINCRSTDIFVAPVYSDGDIGMCVLVPARHSRHLGGNVARWVTDIRLC